MMIQAHDPFEILFSILQLLRSDHTFILLAQLFFVNIFFISCFWLISLSPSCYVIWFSLGIRYIQGCEEIIEFYFAVVIVTVLSQALQIYRWFFFVKL